MEIPPINILDKVITKREETAIIIIDMQNDFVHQKGKLVVPNAYRTVESIKRLLNRAREKGLKVIYTKDTHYEKDPEFEIWGEHVKKGTWGWEIIEELSPQENDIIIEKMRYDAFYGTPLDEILRVFGIKTLIVTGTVANICVLQTIASAALRGYNVVVPIDTISAINDFDLFLTLRQADFVFKGKIVKTADNIIFE